MKTIGLIGGMSWESSLEYYRIINEAVKETLGGLHSAQCLMYSVDFEEIEALQHRDRWDELTDIMVDAALRLKRGGADFIVICTNTMHKMAAEMEKRAGIKVLHIAEVTGEEIRQRKLKTIGLLGTKFTMEQDFYKKIIKDKFHINVVIPNAMERGVVHDVIYNELCKGIIREESKEKYKEIIQHLVFQGAEGIILGCTEIPLLIQQDDCDVPVFDTTHIHALAAVELSLK